MKYLVLGSNSFAGSIYVNHLLSQDNEVIGISRSEQPHSVLRPYEGSQHVNKFNFYSLDINNDSTAIYQLIKKHKPKYFIDFASQSMVAESWLYPDQWYMTNIVSKVRLHEFLRKCDFLERYIRISTPEVYGHTPDRITEDKSFNPTTPYAVSQAATDMSLLAFYRQYNFPVILTRFANFYGPCQQLYRIVPKTIICGLLGKKLPLHGGGTSTRVFIYSTDIVNAIDATIRYGQLGETYHFSSTECVSIASLVQKICKFIKLPY